MRKMEGRSSIIGDGERKRLCLLLLPPNLLFLLTFNPQTRLCTTTPPSSIPVTLQVMVNSTSGKCSLCIIMRLLVDCFVNASICFLLYDLEREDIGLPWWHWSISFLPIFFLSSLLADFDGWRRSRRPESGTAYLGHCRRQLQLHN